MKYEIPATVSPESAVALQTVYGFLAQMARSPERPQTTEAWDQQNAVTMAFVAPVTQAVVDALPVSVREDRLGGVPVLRVTPTGAAPTGAATTGPMAGRRLLVYAHGGAYVLFSARTLLVAPALMAAATGWEVVSIDYTLAPRATWREATDEVLSVYQALLAEGHAPESLGFMGDSAGGGLAAGSILKLRDQGRPLPGALYLMSPWSDITDTGDTCVTLKAADPSLNAVTLGFAADVYAPNAGDQKHPYVSPVHGDYSKPFPPTLIQGGTREIFLSHFVRHYQAIRSGGGQAVLDLYEGMPHVFQTLVPQAPETRTAITRAAAFFDQHLA